MVINVYTYTVQVLYKECHYGLIIYYVYTFSVEVKKISLSALTFSGESMQFRNVPLSESGVTQKTPPLPRPPPSSSSSVIG